VDNYNIKLKLFAERIGIEVYVNDFKKSRNICKFCNKKCSGCDLPKIFDKAFEDYFDGKYN
jgi:wobble nucleotide-excising tRNase